MKKKYKLENLDCANCAAKMEEAIRKIPGVTNASVSFIMQKLTIEAPEEQLEHIMKQVQSCISKVDSDCKVSIL